MRDLALRHLGGIVVLAFALLLLGIAASGRLPRAQAQPECAAGVVAANPGETQLVRGTDIEEGIALGQGELAATVRPPVLVVCPITPEAPAPGAPAGRPVLSEGPLPASEPLLPPEAGAAGAATGSGTVYQGLAMGLGGVVIAFTLGTASLLVRTRARR